jgi:hypothetical protein
MRKWNREEFTPVPLALCNGTTANIRESYAEVCASAKWPDMGRMT